MVPMAEKILKKEDLAKLIASVTGKGGRFVAPSSVARQIVFRKVSKAEEIAPDYIIARNSFKEFLFPQTEVIAEFTMGKDSVDMTGAEVEAPETVVFGARPCEAASLAGMRALFTWDFVDEFFTKRDDNTVVITIGCTKADDACFCTSVNLSPESTEGADVYMRETEEGGYTVNALTDKGRKFVETHAAVFSEGGAKAKAIVMPEKVPGVDLKKISERLKDKSHYDDPVWAKLTRKCIGCGACTFVCPTCRCFDITDEGTAFEGERRKNWDSCQYDSFTLHASGHNPRVHQPQRWRNRFMCKFNFYPEKFSSKGCVGCGRCIRVCPVRLDITEVMQEFSK